MVVCGECVIGECVEGVEGVCGDVDVDFVGVCGDVG